MTGRKKLDQALLASHVHALSEAFDRYAADGWRLAAGIRDQVDPSLSDAHRQAAEDAAEVLEYFNPDGFVFADADEATIVSAIASLHAQALELVPAELLSLLPKGRLRA